MHGGAFELNPGQKYNKELAAKENMPALEKGCENLRVHLENMLSFGVPVVVTVNRFTSDKDKEVDFVVQYALDHKANYSVPIDPWAKGGDGCIKAAEAVVKACEEPNSFHLLYPDDISIKEKIEIIATKIYRADGVDYSPLAEKKIKLYTDLGYGKLCINMAKTHGLSGLVNIHGDEGGYRR